jgi:hypothetical protein
MSHIIGDLRQEFFYSKDCFIPFASLLVAESHHDFSQDELTEDAGPRREADWITTWLRQVFPIRTLAYVAANLTFVCGDYKKKGPYGRG